MASSFFPTMARRRMGRRPQPLAQSQAPSVFRPTGGAAQPPAQRPSAGPAPQPPRALFPGGPLMPGQAGPAGGVMPQVGHIQPPSANASGQGGARPPMSPPPMTGVPPMGRPQMGTPTPPIFNGGPAGFPGAEQAPPPARPQTPGINGAPSPVASSLQPDPNEEAKKLAQAMGQR